MTTICSQAKKTKTDCYDIELTGTSPLMLVQHDMEFSEKVNAWRKDPKNQIVGKRLADEEWSPAWTWLGNMPHEDGVVIVPANFLQAHFLQACKWMEWFEDVRDTRLLRPYVDFGQRRGWPLLINDKPLLWEPIEALMDEPSFKKHHQRVQDMGFDLDIRPVRVMDKRLVRIRPRFDSWKLRFTMKVRDFLRERITTERLQQIWNLSGERMGIGAWSACTMSPMAGPYGRFTAEVDR